MRGRDKSRTIRRARHGPRIADLRSVPLGGIMKNLVAALVAATALLAPISAEAGVVLTSIDPSALDLTGVSGVGGAAAINFVNDLGFAVDIFWINYAGDRSFLVTLQTGQSHAEATDLAHPWIVMKAGAGLVEGAGEYLDGFMGVTPYSGDPAEIDQARIQGAFASVPEPGAWALMIAGFGLAGSALRRRRRALA